MRLKSFHVRVFRNIIDSGPIDVSDVTCLVGKNEAGKSALLQALHHLNPAKPRVALNLLDEYPRWLKKEHEINGEIKNAVPIAAVFELDDNEMEELEAQFGATVLTSREVAVERRYDAAQPSFKVTLDQSSFLEPQLASMPSRLKSAVGTVSTSSDLIKALDRVKGARTDGDEKSTALASEADEARTRLGTALNGANSLTAAVTARLQEWLPRTFYFSTYAQLGARHDLEEVFSAVRNGAPDDEELQAAADFLELARAVPTQIEDWDFEASNAELEAVSSLLTKRVRENWRQNDHLRLRVALEPQVVNGATRRYLQFRVEDTRHDFSNRLDRRSTGFRWFVSFMASFLEFEQDEDLILLLDEPGLSLHARAQMDLLDTIESKIARDRQVLYSTHSPFMVRTHRLAQTRITEDQGPDKGSVVINDVGKVSDPDTLFPLQAALGYDVAQSLFIGNQNVLVEGISDYIYLTMLSEHLASNGRSSLPHSTRLLPAGGATNIPTFIALLGGQLDLVVLVDGNTSTQKIESSVARGRLEAARVLSLDSFSNIKGADIEDLFQPGEYLALYNGTFGTSLKMSDLKGDDRIVKRIGRKAGAFDHGVVAAHFLRNLDKSIKSLSAATVDRFEAVIAAIVAALPSQ